MLFFCSSLHAQFSTSDPLLHQTQHTPYFASFLSNWSTLPRHCQSVVYFPVPVFRRLQVVGRRESWMSAQHPPYLPLTSDPLVGTFCFLVFRFPSVWLRARARAFEHWILVEETRGLGHWGWICGICMDTCARAFAMMPGGRIRADWKRGGLALFLVMLLRICRD